MLTRWALPRAHADRQAASVVVGKTDLRHDLASPFGDRACIFSMNREANADAFSHGHMRGDAIERVLQDELKSAPHPEPFAIRHGPMSSPSNRMWPLSGGSIHDRRRESVDFPQPDSPTSPKLSPANTSKLTPRTA
jgi:hypothetical protein